MQDRSDLLVNRIRHPSKFRLLRVAHVRRITSTLIRVSLTGDDLHDFESASFDDHVKVFFPLPGTDKPVMPGVGPDGTIIVDGPARSPARDYTPRRVDRAARELDLEFTLHDAGPATAWAAQAQPGQWLGIGGPRGSMVIPTGVDWHLLIGDDTALPAIARRQEELPTARASRRSSRSRTRIHVSICRVRRRFTPSGGTAAIVATTHCCRLSAIRICQTVTVRLGRRRSRRGACSTPLPGQRTRRTQGAYSRSQLLATRCRSGA